MAHRDSGAELELCPKIHIKWAQCCGQCWKPQSYNPVPPLLSSGFCQANGDREKDGIQLNILGYYFGYPFWIFLLDIRILGTGAQTVSVFHLENVLPLPGLALGLGAFLPPRLHWSSRLRLTPTLKKGF